MAEEGRIEKRSVNLVAIDHIAIAVHDLEQAICFFRDKVGFELLRRRQISGAHTGMISAEMAHNGLKFVLCQGTEEASQVTKLIRTYGPGVAHIAFEVDDVQKTESILRESGLDFDTDIILGKGLTQVFSSRDTNSGLSFEFIARHGEGEFAEENISSLFAQLEKNEKF